MSYGSEQPHLERFWSELRIRFREIFGAGAGRRFGSNDLELQVMNYGSEEPPQNFRMRCPSAFEKFLESELESFLESKNLKL